MSRLKLRPEVRRFAEAMERKLRSREGERGDSWRRMRPEWLQGRLMEEVGEFLGAVRVRHANEIIADEAADVGNFTMFVAEHLYAERRALR